MNRRKVISSMVVGAAAAATVRVARAADKEIEIFVAHWKKSKDLTLKVADAMPAENYDYKPFPEARSFAGELVHICGGESHYLGMLGKGAAPKAPAAAEQTKPAVIKYVGENYDWAIGVVGQLTEADLTKSFDAGRGASMTGLECLYAAMIHTAHTRGYAEMFLRNKGITPPSYSV
jgi:uncharacterized damage-inducible protein DinB